MPDSEPSTAPQKPHPSRRSDRVESPQQYDNWRDYAFSDAPEHEDDRRR